MNVGVFAIAMNTRKVSIAERMTNRATSFIVHRVMKGIGDMTPEQIAKNVKMLRDEDMNCNANIDDAIQTINALVDLVAEMNDYIWHKHQCESVTSFTKDCTCDYYKLAYKAAPIAELAKGE